MSQYIDESYFQQLGESSPEKICRNNRCTYNRETASYAIEVWGDSYIFYPQHKQLTYNTNGAQPVNDLFDLFVIYYLLLENDLRERSVWISEKDIPGGPSFFRGPHLIPTAQISKRYKNDLEQLTQTCLALGGSPCPMGDAAYIFTIRPEISVTLVYWQGDEDFGPEAKILYDRCLEVLPLDILFALAVGICTRLATWKVEQT